MSDYSLLAGIRCNPILPRDGELVWVTGCYCPEADTVSPPTPCPHCGAKPEYRQWGFSPEFFR